MAWSSDIDDLIDSQEPIPRSYLLEMRNGYQTCEDEAWTTIPIRRDGWGVTIKDGNPVVGNARFNLGVENWDYFDEFDHTNPNQLFAACRLRADITTPSGVESEYIFRGTIRTPQIIDGSILVDAEDPMGRLKVRHAEVDLEADKSGPHDDIRLQHESDIWDDAGTFHTYEIDPAHNCPGPACQDWAVDKNGINRSFVPGAITVEWDNLGVWEPISPSEYIIDTALGLIRFHNDQAGITFQIQNVSVYIEGTLEAADVIEYMLGLDATCAGDLGCGFTNAQLRINLSGTLTFDVANPLRVTGALSDFHGELEPGDRIALAAAPDAVAIVESITPIIEELFLVYPYDQIGGIPGAVGAAFKSTLQASGLNLTKLKFEKCAGMASDLYRKIQDNYTDSKGYKIWYDYQEDQVIGKQVRAMDPDEPLELAKIIDLAPVVKNGLKILSTTEDFGSTVSTSGIIGKAVNLITQPGVIITDLSLALPPVGGFSWQIGPSTGGAPQVWYGCTYRANPNAVYALNDTMTEFAYAVFHDYPPPSDGPPRTDEWEKYFEFIKIDLGAIYDLSTIILFRMNSKDDRLDEMMVVDILGSIDDATYDYLTPETIHYEMERDEVKDFDLEGYATARYIKIKCRPLYAVNSGKELTMGFREIIIYGAQRICTTACIQEDIAHGARQNGTGNITFNAGGPPYTVTGAGTNFGGIGEPQVGDYIAHAVDLDHWGIIEVINAATGVDCVELRYPYNGILPSAGALRFSDGLGAYTEGEGGHFIGGSIADANFIRDYYPDLINKMCAFGHRSKLDDEGLVFTEMQALDRAYLILNEVIRIYRMITTSHGFEIRPRIFDTVHAIDDYRNAGPEDLYYLVQTISITDKGATFSGTEYGAGVLE